MLGAVTDVCGRPNAVSMATGTFPALSRRFAHALLRDPRHTPGRQGVRAGAGLFTSCLVTAQSASRCGLNVPQAGVVDDADDRLWRSWWEWFSDVEEIVLAWLAVGGVSRAVAMIPT
jgi:hypothetical protein